MKFFISKVFVLLVVFVLVQLPVRWIQGLNDERMSFKQDAIDSVSKSYAGDQSVAGPILVFPYTHHYWLNTLNAKGEITKHEPMQRGGTVSVLPDTLNFDNVVDVEDRQVGIFQVPTFKAVIKVTGQFTWDAISNPIMLKSEESLEWGKPYLALPISDQHGIKAIESLTWRDVPVTYEPGSQVIIFGSQGIHAPLDIQREAGNGVASVRLVLVGTESLHNIPTARQTSVKMSSNWPHPQFLGTQLPDERDVTDHGFVANWQSTSLATNVGSLWRTCQDPQWSDESGGYSESHTLCSELDGVGLGVKMIDPTNFYTKMTRALKYGFLFLSITFLSFLLFEVMCDLKIHPIQYTLLGVASGVFFLLLLSLAEQIGFTFAYMASSAACLLLLTLYTHALLKNCKRTLYFSSILATLYGVLFIILQQEDAALLTGSLLIFGLLAIAMMVTRNIDWYAWQQRSIPASQ